MAKKKPMKFGKDKGKLAPFDSIFKPGMKSAGKPNTNKPPSMLAKGYGK